MPAPPDSPAPSSPPAPTSAGGRLRLLPGAVAAAVFGAAASVGVATAVIGVDGAAALIQVLVAAAVLAALADVAVDRLAVRPLAGLEPSAKDADAELERVRAELERLALKDWLTGLLNPAAFEERLGSELRRAQREGYRVAVVSLGIDHFKRINDGWGRSAGDEALRLVAQRIVTELRPSDLCGRIGGDEFMVALVQTGGRDAEEVVRRLRDAIASVEFTPTGETLTASAGFAVFPYDAADAETLIHLAELALRRAKAGGRNRATAHSDYGDADGGVSQLPPARL